MNDNIVWLPTTRGDKWKKEMVSELRRYADMIESNNCEPQIDMFVIGLKQGDKFKFGGCGTETKEDARAMYRDFMEYSKRWNWWLRITRKG